MGAVKNAFHDEIVWNGMSESERQDAICYASGTLPRENAKRSRAKPSGPTGEAGDAQ